MDASRSQEAAGAAPTTTAGRPDPGRWTAPGPGSWVQDGSHVPRPLCRFTSSLITAPFEAGFQETLARYGSLLESLDAVIVDGFLYQRLRPVGAPPEAAGPPPEPVFRELLETAPALRERVATAATVLAERRWRGDLRRWDDEIKPALHRRHADLVRVDLGSLDDAALCDHVDRCARAFAEGVLQHHRHNAPAMLPVGDLVVHAIRWTGLPPAEVLACLAGASPVTEGAPDELAALVRALRGDPAATAVATDETLPADEALSRLLRSPDPVGARADAYIHALAALPLDGEDAVAEPGSLEAPGLLVARIRAALHSDPRARATAGTDAAARVRAAVPAEHRTEFEDLLTEARLVYRLRDERAVHADRLFGSVARAALLEAGRRLAARGAIDEPADAVDLDPAEVRSLLLDGSGPSHAEVAERVRWRRTATYRDMPPLFGPPPAPPVPAEWLPPAAARIHEALGFVVGAVLEDAHRAPEARAVHGLAVSPGSHEGTARVLAGSEELSRIQAGDVLVAAMTGPAFNLVLPRLGAIVTDRGGLLSHAAIVAREFGIPAVVGCQDATEVIPDGARVRVDGGTGTVTVL
ncbi:PEP-utilizing enzyme [Trujillonella endophytica]|uniref:Pyruvate, water dikinase n=1 Tax=Trujillonella endophytica TaxID=673521 RepID=A0A1H8V5H0_9ACTN|nr:PEP-utilizing enzyme [Trujillella endophytica]SEP09988.1 pyruvate, water dikinase [Trujillella endophytica]